MPIEAKSPWEIIGVDLFTLDDKEYLLTIDYFSGFWEVDKLSSTTTEAVVKKLKVQFSRYGVPCTLMALACLISDLLPRSSMILQLSGTLKTALLLPHIQTQMEK